MKRSYLHLLVDSLLLLGALGLILTGLLMEFVLPAGSHQSSVWSLTRHEWGDLHFWTAVGMLALGLLHLLLNWGWVCSVCAKVLRLRSTKPTPRRKLVTGGATLVLLSLLVGGFLFAAEAGKITDPQGEAGHGRGGGQGRGQIERSLDDLFLDGH